MFLAFKNNHPLSHPIPSSRDAPPPSLFSPRITAVLVENTFSSISTCSLAFSVPLPFGEFVCLCFVLCYGVSWSPCWLWIHCIAKELAVWPGSMNPPASTSQVLRIQGCAIMLGWLLNVLMDKCRCCGLNTVCTILGLFPWVHGRKRSWSFVHLFWAIETR